jgi:hypothetical protein
MDRAILVSVIPGRAKREPGISIEFYNLEIPDLVLRTIPE